MEVHVLQVGLSAMDHPEVDRMVVLHTTESRHVKVAHRNMVDLSITVAKVHRTTCKCTSNNVVEVGHRTAIFAVTSKWDSFLRAAVVDSLSDRPLVSGADEVVHRSTKLSLLQRWALPLPHRTAYRSLCKAEPQLHLRFKREKGRRKSCPKKSS
mmetsp:Transcript_3602/g.8933  ORF Transcript_3602/g.8933 Transcript_3602/m.8933 type:complete len:154 (+) Transcript_3602:1287-1748(+)